MLRGKIGPLVNVVRMEESLLRFLETDSSPRISPKALALPLIEVESHDGITVIPYSSREIKKNLEKTLLPCRPGPGMLLVALAKRPQVVA